MASEIRVNTINNRSGLGTVNFTDSGVIVSGVATANSFSGDLTGNVTGNATGLSGSPTLTGITSISTTNLTVNGNSYPSAGPLSNRNIIINGSMVVNQRGYTGAAGTTQGYHVDRFLVSYSQDGAISVGQTTMNSTTGGNAYADGFQNATYLEVTTADTSLSANQFISLNQTVEGYNLQGIKKGTVNAQPTTLSFWVRSNTTGTYICELNDIDNSRQVSQEYTINVADTWEKKSLTFPADTTGVFDNDNGLSLYVNWWLGSGTTYSSGTLNTSWAATTQANRAVGQTNLLATVGNNFWFTGVQLETGSVATPFEHRSYGDELARCQRYYFETTNAQGTVYDSSGTTNCGLSAPFPVRMRIIPTMTLPLSISDHIHNFGAGNNTYTGGGNYGTNVDGGRMFFTGGTSRSTGTFSVLNSNAPVKFDAELT